MAISVCHIVSGDLWAGAECQVVNLLSQSIKSPNFEFSAITFNPGRLTSELQDLGLKVTCLPERRLSPLRILLGIRKHIIEQSAEIVHCHGHKEHILGCMAGLLSGRHPKVMRTLHGMCEPFSGSAKVRAACFSWIQDIFMRFLTHKIIVVSQRMKQSFCNRPWAKKIVCIHNGIDSDRVKPSVSREEMRSRLGIEKDDFVIGTACRLVPIKRIDLLLEAFRIVNQNHSKTLLVISGDGILLSRLQDDARRLGIEERVRFLGHRDDIYDVMSTFDVFVMTSECEGIPMVLLEALALGIPVLAPDVGGIPEILAGSPTTLFKPLCTKSIVERLMNEVEDPANNSAGYLTSGKPISEEFSAKRTALRTTSLYEQLKFNAR